MVLCAHCRETILDGDEIMSFNNGDVLMHRNCGLRGIIGSVAHVQKKCSCYVKGATETDPPEITAREAANAAVAFWEEAHCENKGSHLGE